MPSVGQREAKPNETNKQSGQISPKLFHPKDFLIWIFFITLIKEYIYYKYLKKCLHLVIRFCCDLVIYVMFQNIFQLSGYQVDIYQYPTV